MQKIKLNLAEVYAVNSLEQEFNRLKQQESAIAKSIIESHGEKIEEGQWRVSHEKDEKGEDVVYLIQELSKAPDSLHTGDGKPLNSSD